VSRANPLRTVLRWSNFVGLRNLAEFDLAEKIAKPKKKQKEK
jgi:hypothetical protein